MNIPLHISRVYPQEHVPGYLVHCEAFEGKQWRVRDFYIVEAGQHLIVREVHLDLPYFPRDAVTNMTGQYLTATTCDNELLLILQEFKERQHDMANTS